MPICRRILAVRFPFAPAGDDGPRVVGFLPGHIPAQFDDFLGSAERGVDAVLPAWGAVVKSCFNDFPGRFLSSPIESPYSIIELSRQIPVRTSQRLHRRLKIFREIAQARHDFRPIRQRVAVLLPGYFARRTGLSHQWMAQALGIARRLGHEDGKQHMPRLFSHLQQGIDTGR